MNLWDQFLWVIFPYLALATFVIGHIYRYVYDQYGWTAKSSEMLEKRLLMWGVLLFHWGLALIFIGHVMGLLIPIGVYRGMGISDENYHLLSLWGGAPAGFVTLAGILLLNLRRWFVRRVRVTSTRMDFATDALLLIVIVLGMSATIGYRIYVDQVKLPGEFEYRATIGPWFRSLFTFSPNPELMVDAPLIFQLHTLSAFLLFALWPFSRLVHAWSFPVRYIRRSYVLYRSSNPKRALARDRAKREMGSGEHR